MKQELIPRKSEISDLPARMLKHVITRHITKIITKSAINIYRHNAECYRKYLGRIKVKEQIKTNKNDDKKLFVHSITTQLFGLPT
jgi:hypothetical protein